MKYFLIWQDPDDPDQGTDHGWTELASEEEMLRLVNMYPNRIWTIIHGQHVELESVERVKTWKVK